MTKEQAELELIALVKQEVEQNEKEQVWVTDQVAFNMREMIKENRKNYWGIYDEEKDPVTKRKKIWVPLTQMLCDAVRKNVDLDPKHIRFRSKFHKFTHLTHVVRGYVRELMSRWYFGHTLNQAIFTMVVDGTEVWKTYTVDGMIKRKDVDLLNVYIDPTAESIQDAYRFTERVLMTKSEANQMDWDNVEQFAVKKDLEKEGDSSSIKKTGLYGDVYEMWGKIPRKLINLDDNDTEEIDAHVVISGIDTGHTVFHLAEENKNKDKDGNIIKPYEEAWYIKVPGRWYGLSIPEIVRQLQYWINTVVNLRINKNTVAQLGLLKIAKKERVTQRMINQLVSKGVIELNDPAALEQLQIAESGQSSYEDEKVAKNWAQEVTSVFDINLAELPASTSATGAAIQDRQAKSAFTLVVEGSEHFIQRWFDRHVLPQIPGMMKKDQYARVFRDFEDIKAIRKRVLSHIALQVIERAWKEDGRVPSEENLLKAMDRAARQLEERGDLIVDTVEEIIAKQLDTEVFMTNTEIDVGVTVRNLLELRNGVDPQTSAEMTAQALDLLGLEVPEALKNPQPLQQPQQQARTDSRAITDTQLVTDANTLNNEQR